MPVCPSKPCHLRRLTRVVGSPPLWRGQPGTVGAARYTAKSGAIIFASGTMYWARGLTGYSDDRIQQATPRDNTTVTGPLLHCATDLNPPPYVADYQDSDPIRTGARLQVLMNPTRFRQEDVAEGTPLVANPDGVLTGQHGGVAAARLIANSGRDRLRRVAEHRASIA